MTKKVTKKTNTVKKEPNNRKVPFKNYIILLFLCFLTLGIVFAISNYYRKIEQKELETPVISGIVSEIKKEDLDNYIVENPDFFLWIGSSYNYNSRDVEKDLIEYFKKNDIKDRMIYLNVSNEKELDDFYDSFNSKYVEKDYAKLFDYPAFVIIRDGKVLDLVQKKTKQKLTISDIDRLLGEYSY